MNRKKYTRLLVISFSLIILIIKVYVAIVDNGFKSDLILYKNWASSFLQYGFNIYEQKIYIDYPPLYPIILSPFVWIYENIETLNIIGVKILFLKIPSIIADFISAYLIYKIIYRRTNKDVISLLAALFYLIHPAVIINSSAWGQTDSILTTLLIGVLILISNKNLKGAMIICTLAILFKPTSLLFIPLIGLLFIIYKDIKEQIISIIIFCVTTLVIVLPFKGFSLIELYLTDINKYPSAALNAANIHTLLGGNIIPYNEKVLGLPITFHQMGVSLTCVFMILIAYLIFVKRNSIGDWIFTLSWLYCTGVFMFMSGMHERYQFFGVALGLLALFENINKINSLSIVYIFQSVIIALNQLILLHCTKADMQKIKPLWFDLLQSTFRYLAFFNLLCFIALTALIISNLFKANVKEQEIDELISHESENYNVAN